MISKTGLTQIPNRLMPLFCQCCFLATLLVTSCDPSRRSGGGRLSTNPALPLREQILLDEGWRFYRYAGSPDNLFYDNRPEVRDRNDNVVADSKPTEAVKIGSGENSLKKWVLPSANPFISEPSKRYKRPPGDPGSDFPFVQNNFDDSGWEEVNLPHDWAVAGPFYVGENVPVGGGMGRLPVQGVAWYRHKLDIPASDKGRNVFLDIEGAMSYAIVWINGHLAGGWPYGYNSFRIDLTPYLRFGGDNQLAIRLDNPANSSRWYPGAGIYRHVWLTKTRPVHIGQWGTFFSTRVVSKDQATVDLAVNIDNSSAVAEEVMVVTEIYEPGDHNSSTAKPIMRTQPATYRVAASGTVTAKQAVIIPDPKRWGPPPLQAPQLYWALTTLYVQGKPVDQYHSSFGIRTISMDPQKGLLLNDQPVRIQGVNQHHDLGALGAAFNLRAARRQLEILRELGCNAIRFSHNPPAPELLELTDQMGFLVIDEIFDCWEQKKTPLDFHLIFPEWHEADTRAFIRRDRNHPSIVAWSFGNEVGEQYTGEAGAALAQQLYSIVKEEDPTRAATVSMNYAKPGMPLPAVVDILNLNYQGEGIRDAPAYAHLNGIRTTPLYPAFHEKYPGKLIVSSETASALSTRGSYLFPVAGEISAPVSDGRGGDPVSGQVSAYELYTAAFGASPDKVFGSQDKHPYVAGEFVWSGWDYLGEPTPYYSARSSYSGIIDLAGFPKDRFFLYQSRWRPELPMVHILPHWNWPERLGQVTPVHVFTSGDEAELFLNGKSLGRKKKDAFTYRLRWDEVAYQPGELKVIAYKEGKRWAEASIQTTGDAYRLQLETDRSNLAADGKDLSFITVTVRDRDGRVVPTAANDVEFRLEGPGKIVATDNGDPTDLVAFPSIRRKAFFGYLLVIVKANKGQSGLIHLTATSPGLQTAMVEMKTK